MIFQRNDEMIIKDPSLKRIGSFTSHLHQFTVVSPIKHHSPVENGEHFLVLSELLIIQYHLTSFNNNIYKKFSE